ncbi:MAG: DUF1189 family protein, partial [bacterium]
ITTITNNVKEQLPLLKLKGDRWIVEANTPYRIQLDDEHVFIIDPSGTLNRKKLSLDVVGVAVNGGVYYRMYNENYWYNSISGPPKQKAVEITPELIDRWLPALRILLLITLFVLGSIMLFFSNIVRVGLISIGGFFSRNQANFPIPLSTILKISCYAVTPLALIETILGVLRVRLPMQELILLIAGTIWVYFIVREIIANSIRLEDDLSGDSEWV